MQTKTIRIMYYDEQTKQWERDTVDLPVVDESPDEQGETDKALEMRTDAG